MKLIGYLIIAAGLVLGALGASTAYLADLSLADEVLLPQGEPRAAGEAPGKEVAGEAAAAGAEENWLILAGPVWPPESDPDEVTEPLAATGALLTPELLAQLRSAEVEYIRVKSFAFARWEGKWWTLMGVVGLLVGAVLVRRGSADRRSAAEGEAGGAGSPEVLMEQAREKLLSLRAQAEQIPEGHERAHLIMERVGDIQREQMNPVVEGQGRLRARLGLAGYARVMDRFAAAERQVNRAWSSAADGDDDEAMSCLVRGAESLEEARQRLQEAGAPAR